MYKLTLSICVSVAVLALAGCGKKEATDGATEAAAPADAPAAMMAGAGPGLKAGLWEASTQMHGIQVVSKVCLDEALGAEWTKNAGPLQQGDLQCNDQKVVRNGDVIDVSAVCTQGGREVNTQIRMEMKGDTAYRQTIRGTFDPPQEGLKEFNTTIDGKWVGPCGAEMKPGDMILPGGIKMNVADAAKSK